MLEGWVEKLINLFIISIFFVLAISSLYKLEFNGEVFLNYSDGFIRRGFLGSIIYLLDKYLVIDPYQISIIFNFLIKSVLFIIVAVIVFVYKIPKLTLLSYPLLLTGLLNSNGKLDFLLLLLFIINFLLVKPKTDNRIIIFTVINVIGILVHEVFFFLIIVPIAVLYFQSRSKKYIVSLFVCLVVFVLCTSFYIGTYHQVVNIEYNWGKLGFSPHFNYVYSCLVSGKTFYINNIITTTKQLFGFLINNLLCIAFIIFSISKFVTRKEFFFFSLIIFIQNVIFLSLCIIACDYSRWYFLLFTSVVIFLFIYRPDANIKLDNNSKFFKHLNELTLKRFYYYSIVLYFIISIPFAGWSFNSYYHSLLYFKITDAIKLVL